MFVGAGALVLAICIVRFLLFQLPAGIIYSIVDRNKEKSEKQKEEDTKNGYLLTLLALYIIVNIIVLAGK